MIIFMALLHDFWLLAVREEISKIYKFSLTVGVDWNNSVNKFGWKDGIKFLRWTFALRRLLFCALSSNPIKVFWWVAHRSLRETDKSCNTGWLWPFRLCPPPLPVAQPQHLIVSTFLWPVALLWRFSYWFITPSL